MEEDARVLQLAIELYSAGRADDGYETCKHLNGEQGTQPPPGDHSVNQGALMNQLKVLRQRFQTKESIVDVFNRHIETQQRVQDAQLLQTHKLVHIHDPSNAVQVAQVPPHLSPANYQMRCCLCGLKVNVQALRQHLRDELRDARESAKQQLANQQIQQINQDFGL